MAHLILDDPQLLSNLLEKRKKKLGITALIIIQEGQIEPRPRRF